MGRPQIEKNDRAGRIDTSEFADGRMQHEDEDNMDVELLKSIEGREREWGSINHIAEMLPTTDETEKVALARTVGELTRQVLHLGLKLGVSPSAYGESLRFSIAIQCVYNSVTKRKVLAHPPTLYASSSCPT